MRKRNRPPQLVLCPKCDHEFGSGTHKCCCHHCGTAFFRGQSNYGDLSEPLVPRRPLVSLDQVDGILRRKAHSILHGLEEHGGPFGWYGFACLGLDGIAEWLVELGYVKHVAISRESAYQITLEGQVKLKMLSNSQDGPAPLTSC